MVKLSVVIVSWNAKSFLLKCLQSVMQETSKYKTEIIVIDNASTDRSAELVEEQFPSIILVRNKTNLGFAKAIAILPGSVLIVIPALLLWLSWDTGYAAAFPPDGFTRKSSDRPSAPRRINS